MSDERGAIDLLRRLVEAESVNPPGRTLGPAGILEARLTGRGLAPRVVAADPNKPNLVATITRGSGPHLVLNAHLDTIAPGDVAAWSCPPFALTERDGRLAGLGTGNMKAAAAAITIAFERLAEAHAAWSGRVTLTLVADECVFGPDGAAHLLAGEPALAGDMLICGEGPGSMALGVAEKGLMWVRLRAVGPVGQGMLARRGSSAIARLARALAEVDGWNDLRAAPPLASLDHGGNAEGMRLSANIGRIEGGGFISQAASEAVGEIDVRIPPGMTRAAIADRFDALCVDAGLDWTEIKGWEPNWSDPASSVARAVRDAAARVRGVPPPDVARLPASDASRWRRLGVPAVCFGPQAELASGIDDYVHKQDFLDCIAIYEHAALALLQTAE